MGRFWWWPVIFLCLIFTDDTVDYEALVSISDEYAETQASQYADEMGLDLEEVRCADESDTQDDYVACVLRLTGGSTHGLECVGSQKPWPFGTFRPQKVCRLPRVNGSGWLEPDSSFSDQDSSCCYISIRQNSLAPWNRRF